MDDIFQIIIWLFIIISFFASFFKKKEQPKQQPPPRRYGNEQETFPAKDQSASSVDKEEYDILREIENMFKTDTSQPTTMEKKEEQYYNRPAESEHTRKQEEYTSYERTRKADEYTSYETGRSPLETSRMDTTRLKREKELTSSEHTMGDYVKRQSARKVPEVDIAVSKQAEEFEKFLKRKEKTNVMAANIRSRIKQPASFKEYIIMAEILGKPAFKTGGRAFRKS